MADPSGSSEPLTYKEAYDAVRSAVKSYPLIAVRMQLDRIIGPARTEAQWGAVDALTDLLTATTGPQT